MITKFQLKAQTNEVYSIRCRAGVDMIYEPRYTSSPTSKRKDLPAAMFPISCPISTDEYKLYEGNKEEIEDESM